MRYTIILIFSLFFLCANSQGFRTRYYPPGSANNIAKAIFETTPGNYIAGGTIVDGTTGLSQLCISGLNAQGLVLWKKKYGNNQFQFLNNNLIGRSFYKRNNEIYYTGCVRDSNNKQIGVLIKFNLNGDTLWQKIYRDPDPLEDVIPQLMTNSVDGGLLITGFFQNNSSNPYRKCMLIKTDINGNELWRQKIAKVTPDTQDGKAIVQDSASKKIVIVGYQYIGNASSWGNYDNILILDSLGVKLSQHNYAGSGVQGVLLDLIQTSDKKMVAVGFAIYEENNMGTYELYSSYIVKFDLNNPVTPIWKINNFDGLTFGNGIYCLTSLKNNEILTGGCIDTMQMYDLPPNCFTRLTKIDQNGNVTWNRYYDYKTNAPGTANYQTIKALNLCADGSWLGAIECMNPSPNPFFFVKWDSTGCDTTEAYCRLFNNVGINANKFYDTRISISPNPTSDKLYISGINENEEFEFTLTDLTGRRIKIQQSDYSEKQIVDLKNIESGVYLITATKNKQIIYQSKLVKVD